MFCQIYQDRQGKQVDWDLVKSSFEVIRNAELDNQLEQNSCMKNLSKEKTSLMEKYTVGLEKPLLADCSSYYSRLATDHVQKYSCSEYMLMIAQHELLVVQHKHLFEKDDSGLKILLKCGMTFTKSGVELVKKAKDADEKKVYIIEDCSSIPRLYCEFVIYIKNYLNDDFRFHKALGNAYEILRKEVGCNMTTAEMLAKHAHDILKKGGGIDKQSNSAFEYELDKIAGLVPYINDKNMFAELHRKKLMLRLLYDKNTDIEHENYFILSLKKHNATVLTSKMERMITDLSLSRKTQRDFKNFLETHQGENADPSIDMVVTILTAGVWPSLKSSSLHLPSEMAHGAELFKEFYNSRNNKKKLTWIHTLSTCNLIGHFDKKSIELILTTYQASALMLFNDAERLSFEEIMIQLNLDKDDLVWVLHSLSCSKYKILKKEPSSESVSHDDHFKFNSEFTVTMRKIKVPLPRVEDKEVIREMKNKQQYAIAAAITRIMKRRKVLGINELVDECIQQLNHLFEPSFRMIKLQIDSLIDKEYLDRDANQPNVFKYVA
ncbi:E3 ubiquitin ligase Cullin 2 component protein [Dioscorea alata]|uniref:E3 ubiquitin ligase Cullin 2 component protein n=1 Tax=Dioscorea alata TaxID=55571 RepID=A0ACB7U3X7_DIOAL|nr:E3 ubiquitin ligase Cullin 2 component protein [Dioscorea alata]